jgi:hypothetical protein
VWGTLRKIDTAYGTALRRAKILDDEVTFHTFRHTFASHYVMRGGSIVKLQATWATPASGRRRSALGSPAITSSAPRAFWRPGLGFQDIVSTWACRPGRDGAVRCAKVPLSLENGAVAKW